MLRVVQGAQLRLGTMMEVFYCFEKVPCGIDSEKSSKEATEESAPLAWNTAVKISSVRGLAYFATIVLSATSKARGDNRVNFGVW